MSSYTTQMKTLIERYSQHKENLSHAERIEIGRPYLFNFDYPIFDEKYRPIFETHLIRNFYMREIGFEVEGLFKFNLETWLQINMPYYNQLFESELIKFNPMYNVDLTEDYNLKNSSKKDEKRDIENVSKATQKSTTDTTTTNTGHSDTSSKSTNFDRTLTSDTPQDRLAITSKNGEGVIEYATSINENLGTSSGTGEQDTKSTGKGNQVDDSTYNSTMKTDNDLVQNINSTDDYLRHLVGKQGNDSYSKMLNEYRSTFLRIERDIFKELNQLFMLIY